METLDLALIDNNGKSQTEYFRPRNLCAYTLLDIRWLETSQMNVKTSSHFPLLGPQNAGIQVNNLQVGDYNFIFWGV